jgi:hypothetical protein
MIDWTDPNARVSPNFTVKEMLYCNLWGRMATEADGLNDTIKTNLASLCLKLELIRDFFQDRTININSGYRPPKYSPMVGGFSTDVHTMGMAADFTVSSVPCAEAKALLLPKLAEFGIRMEDNGTGNWIHVDTHSVIVNRFFKP